MKLSLEEQLETFARKYDIPTAGRAELGEIIDSFRIRYSNLFEQTKADNLTLYRERERAEKALGLLWEVSGYLDEVTDDLRLEVSAILDNPERHHKP